MLVLAGTVLAVLLVVPMGGRLRELSLLRLTSGHLVLLALAAQVLALEVLASAARPLLVLLHGLSYVLAGLFVLRNLHVPGLVVLAAGTALNALVLSLNGGTMPASAAAYVSAGIPLENDSYTNSGVLDSPHLSVLGDVFATPDWLPLQNVYSPGDLLILAGAVWAVHRTCRSVIARDPRPLLARLRGSASSVPAAHR